MKKNLLVILTFALTLVNLVLTAILAITIMPEVKKVNEFVTIVCDAIDLDLQAATGAESTESVSLENVDVYALADDLTINLKNSTNGESHIAVIGVTLSLNKNSESYTTYGGDMDTYSGIIKSTINSVVSQYTLEEIKEDQSAVQRQIKNELNAQFGNGLVVNVGFSKAIFQ